MFHAMQLDLNVPNEQDAKWHLQAMQCIAQP